ncbi:MAG: NAD-dependent epimerase/dehydratase family protein [Spirochaetaceae bacterium]
MKILIPGGAGYIGSVLATELLKHGHELRVVDLLWFNRSTPLIHYSNPSYEFIRDDITKDEVIDRSLEGVDFVIYPAAVVGDPASNKYPELTKETNEIAAKKIIKRASKYGLKGFVYFSTCSNYGISGDELANEDTNLNPLSLYAETKVNVERYLQQEVSDMDWVIGRLSTVYGIGPRMRFDLTVNEFALKGFMEKYIDIYRPESYRPYVHVYDLSRIINTIVDKFDGLKNNVFNIGFPGENYKKIQIAEAVKKYLPDTQIDILKSGGDDRDYQVDFSKLHRFLDIDKVYDVDKSVEETIRALEDKLFGDTSREVFSNTTPNFSWE